MEAAPQAVVEHLGIALKIRQLGILCSPKTSIYMYTVEPRLINQ